MRTIIFSTPEEQANGLQYRPVIEPDTLFVFPYIRGGSTFHSRNVRAPFDIAFVNHEMMILDQATMIPERAIRISPPGTYMALEAAAGQMAEWGFAPGVRVHF